MFFVLSAGDDIGCRDFGEALVYELCMRFLHCALLLGVSLACSTVWLYYLRWKDIFIQDNLHSCYGVFLALLSLEHSSKERLIHGVLVRSYAYERECSIHVFEMNFDSECEYLLSKFVDERVTLWSWDIFLCRSLLEC